MNTIIVQGLLGPTIVTQGYIPSLAIIPPYPFETMPRFYQSIIATLQESDIFGPQSVFYTVDPDDAEIKWPQTPPPFALVVPGEAFDAGAGTGAGRFGKNWEVFWEIRVVVRNILDDSWHDTNAVTTLSAISGSYPNVDAVLNIMEQSYPLDTNNQLSMTELPYCIGVGKLTRFKYSQEYLYIPLYFRCEFCSYLPASLP